ncbi:hypothetical protein [Tateyamaria sp. SN6-1]|uniref:hypothetical protein n=1 Tax=Tateyamaria sp. SN6-1 TaxID=3092148 RepID=UPI0039F628B1
MPHRPVLLIPDADGFVTPRAAPDALQTPWRAPLDHIAQACRGVCGPAFHSLYVRGSVAVGQAREHISDIDAVVLTRAPVPGLDKRWRDALSDRIVRKWRFVHSVEVMPLTKAELFRSAILSALLKTQAFCHAGQDVVPDLPRCRLGLDLMFESWTLPNDIALARGLQSTPKAHQARMWVAKKIIRSSFELVMQDAGFYTRDLSVCRAQFLRKHPDHAPLMRHGFEMATGQGDQAFDALTAFGTGWLYPEVCRVYGADLITRAVHA